MDKRELKLIANAKLKEFDRLKVLSLNQMSVIEMGLNPGSIGRNPYGTLWTSVPSQSAIYKLTESLTELRRNMLTQEEKESLNA